MSGFLVDTSVISIFAPGRQAVPLALQHWIVDQGARGALFVSSIVILEIQRGISRLRRAGGTTRASGLDHWLGSLLVDFREQTLSVDTEIARLAGEIEDAAIARGRNPGLADILNAATALTHDLTVVTSNMRHFEPLGVRHLDPFKDNLPSG